MPGPMSADVCVETQGGAYAPEKPDHLRRCSRKSRKVCV